MSVVQQALDEFNEESLTFKLLTGVYTAVPYSPAFPHWRSVDDAVRTLKPDATQEDLIRAQQIAQTNQEVANILWMAKLLDAGDKGYAIVTGLHTAFKLFKGQGMEALETDDQQRNDAILKALGLAYMVYYAYPGTVQQKAIAFRDSPTGQAMMMYYGSIEVALPFADNVAQYAGGSLSNMLNNEAGGQANRLAQMAQGHNLEGAIQMLSELTDRLQRVADHATNHIKPVAEQIGPYVAGGANIADKAAGALANAADVMPVYRLLGSRLAAESAARRALGIV